MFFKNLDQSCDTNNKVYHVNISWKIIDSFLCLAHMQPTKKGSLSTVYYLTNWLVCFRHCLVVSLSPSTKVIRSNGIRVVICLDCRSLQLLLFVQWMVSCFWFKFEQCQFLSVKVLMFMNFVCIHHSGGQMSWRLI